MQDRSPRRRVAASAGLAALALSAACVPDWGNPPPTTTTTTTTTSTTTTTIPEPVDPTFLGRYATGLGITSAETVAFDDFVSCGGMAKAKEAGKVRLEGKEYVVADADIMNFRFAN